MADIILMDGGMGQELRARSRQPASPLWSTQVLMDEPDLVEAVHRDFIDAGAKIIMLNTYTATPERLARDARADLFEPLQAKAIAIARAAIDGRAIALAGCLPPLAASYHSDAAPDFDQSLTSYRRIVACQKDAVDVLVCETLTTTTEIRAAVQAGVESGLPVWCAMSVNDQNGTQLRSGELLTGAANVAKEAGATALAINCSRPEAVADALPILAETGLPFGAWANGFVDAEKDLAVGSTVDGMRSRTDLGPDAYADHALDWVKAGATIIGGCCEVGPAHIATLADRLRDAGHRLVAQLPDDNGR